MEESRLLSSDAAMDEAHRIERSLHKATLNRLREEAWMETVRTKLIACKPKLKSEETDGIPWVGTVRESDRPPKLFMYRARLYLRERSWLRRYLHGSPQQ